MAGLRVLAAALAAGLAAAGPAPASYLRTEYVVDPIVIQPELVPRFFWTVDHTDRGQSQSAYRIVVNTTTNNDGSSQVFWDSGLVTSNATTQVVYGGPALQSDSSYLWTVQWTDASGVVAPWSDVARFGTGLQQAEWAPSAWIGCPSALNFNQLRAEFALNLPAGVSIVQARMYVTGVGYYLARVNGMWAQQWSPSFGPDGEYEGRPRLDPGWTTYEYRTLYNAYDLTASLLPRGNNAIAIMVGYGWPNIAPVPGNSSSASEGMGAGALDYRSDEFAEALVDARLEGHTGARLAAGNNAQRRLRVQIHVRLSNGNTTVWTSTANSFDAASSSAVRSGQAAPLGQWMCGTGALLDDDVYNGCSWDQRLYTSGWDLPGYAYSGGNWTQAVLVADPGGANPTTMTAQAFQPVAVIQPMPAMSFQSPSPGVYVFDFGQNMAGIVRLSLPAPVPAGVTITMRHAELLQHPPYGPKDGNIYIGNLRSAKATDVYVTGGSETEPEVWEPIFTYHGFRFVEVTGLPSPPDLTVVTALHMRTAATQAGSLAFPYSAEPLNQLQRAVTWGIASNLMSVISDCPQRDERKGWMGDSGLSLWSTVYNWDVAALWTAWATNIRDSQVYKGESHPAGSVADTTPHTFGSYPSDPSWGTAYPGIVYTMWRVYGDTRIAADHYPNLQNYVSFMLGEVNKAGPGATYEYYGDWCPPPAQLNGGQGPKPPKSYCASLSFLGDLQRMVEIATALGKSADAANYKASLTAIMAQFNGVFLHSGTGVYGNPNGNGLQTANAMALSLGIVPSAEETAVVSALVNDVANTHNGHWATGIIGMKHLHTALTNAGYSSLALQTLLQTDYPSFGWEFNHPDEPATTLWELPDGPTEGPGMNSRNHHMFSSVGGWMYYHLAGLTQLDASRAGYNPADPTQSGFAHPVIYPRAASHASVGFVTGDFNSIVGRYTWSWVNSSGPVCVTNAPENAPITLSCPPGSTFSAVDFASFGLPTGVCGNYTSNAACNAKNSSAVVAGLCVGQSSCTIDVSDTLFGDPCYDVVKTFSAQLSCGGPGPAGGQSFLLSASVPTNGAATIKLPFSSAVSPASVSVYESGTGNALPVWVGGAFKPGVPGVRGAALNTEDAAVGTVTIDVVVGAGSYNFAIGA